MKLATRILFLAIILLTINNQSALAISPCSINVPEFRAAISRIVDGDTVAIIKDSEEYKVRLLNIDTPETNYRGKSQGELAEKAKQKITDLLPVNTEVLVQTSVEKCDRYSRVLGILKKPKNNSWKTFTNINYQLILSGLAVPYIIYPNLTSTTEMLNGAQLAAQAKRGIYNPTSTTEIPYIWRRIIDGRTFQYFVGDNRRNCFVDPDNLSFVPVVDRIFFNNKTEAEKIFPKLCVME